MVVDMRLGPTRGDAVLDTGCVTISGERRASVAVLGWAERDLSLPFAGLCASE